MEIHNYSTYFKFIRNDNVEYDSRYHNTLLSYKPVISRPRRNTTATNILGGGVATYDYESYENIEINLPLIFQNFDEDNINQIMDFFYYAFNGVGGILYLSWINGYFKVIEVLNAELEDIKSVIEGRVIFLCEPCRRENIKQTICTKNTKIYLPFNAVSTPCNFQIKGSGEVQFSINDEVIRIKNLATNNHVCINAIPPIFIYDSNNHYRGKDVYCNITKLKMKSGANEIKFLSGTINEVKVIYQTMYL